MDNKTPKQRSENMRHIRDRDSVIEIKLRKALWEKGYRYRKNYSKLPGKPDIVLTKFHIAIFCDSEFFHGKDWGKLEKQLHNSNNSEFWRKKISRNIERDIEVNQELRSMGWIVLRFWGDDIKKDINGCIKTIEETILDIICT